MSNPRPKDMRIAIIITALSGIIILGIGHLYIGQTIKGVILIAASVVLLFFGGSFSWLFGSWTFLGTIAAVVGLYIYQLVDVWRTLRRQHDMWRPWE